MRFLGNKTRMLENLDEFIKKHNIKGKIFCDLFTGSSSVADHFKDRYQIIANDLLTSSCYYAKAKIYNSNVPEFNNFKKEKGVDPFTYFNLKEYEMLDGHFLLNNYSPKGDRMFLTEIIANKIDGIRLELDKMKETDLLDTNEYNFLIASLLETTMRHSNTTGTYEAFLKDWDSRALKDFDMKPFEIEVKKIKSKNNVVYNDDANNLIRKIEGDILYLDTPYTITDYNSAYHLLETIAKYDKPEIKGKTGRRTDKGEKSPYSTKTKALDAYEDLIKHARFKNIIISYSTQSLISIEELIEMLKKYSLGDVIIEYYPFREYKNIRSSQKGDNLREALIYLKKNIEDSPNIIKSPLNYSGSKNYIVDQIKNFLPKTIDTFVDAMGGAFNVGVNIENANTVVYNEYNKFVFEIIDYLLREDKNRIKHDVAELVDNFKLVKGDKNTYIKFRNYYNNHKNPLNLFVLQMYCFQNQLRFNSSHDFNTPVGNCGCNESTYDRIDAFIPKSKKIITTNLDFADIDYCSYPKDTVFYFDPPYIITNATYNDGKRGFKGWTLELENNLYAFIDKINGNGQKFMLSNVIYHNGKTNEILLSWANKNNYKIIELKPHNGRYGARKEVLVINY